MMEACVKQTKNDLSYRNLSLSSDMMYNMEDAQFQPYLLLIGIKNVLYGLACLAFRVP